jgi:hypothetical protein
MQMYDRHGKINQDLQAKMSKILDREKSKELQWQKRQKEMSKERKTKVLAHNTFSDEHRQKVR